MDWGTDDDDDAILLDSALNGVCHEDLQYLMEEFGVKLPPVKAERHPSYRKRHKRYVETRQRGENTITTLQVLQQTQSYTEEGGIPEVAGPSEYSEDEQQRTASSSSDDGQDGSGPHNCVNCNNPKKYTKIYGMNLCSACQKFITVMAKQGFKTICIGGQGKCNTTYSDGHPVRCQSCRLKNMLKLDIQHHAWLRYKAEHKINSDIGGDSRPQDDELYSGDVDEDCESATLGYDNSSSEEYSSSESDTHEQDGGVALLNLGKSESEQSRCASCDASTENIYHGISVCIACRKFVFSMAKRKFKVHCIGGLGNCRTTYKAGERIRCSSCRLKKMLKLDIRHEAWVRYKAVHGLKISSDFAQQESADRSKEPHNSDKDSNSTSSSPGHLDVEEYTSSESSIDERDGDISSSDHSESGCESSECAGCRAPSRKRCYGMVLCYACVKFISIIAKKKFKVDCIGGQGHCRTTYSPDNLIRCPSCRLKRLMKINIRHPEWVKYKAKHGIENETLDKPTPQDEDLYSDDDEGRENVASSYDSTNDSTNDREHISSKSRIDERKEIIAPPLIRDQSVRERPKCVGCNAPSRMRCYGLVLCSACRAFIVYVADRNNFNVTCCVGQGMCRTTYIAGDSIKCASCRIKKLMNFDVGHPAWIKYKAERGARDETFDTPVPQDNERDSDDVDEDMKSVGSNPNNELAEATMRFASKSLIEPEEDCDADDEIEMIEIDCD